MALTHLQVVVVGGVHRAFWVLNRDCYRVRALSWEEQQSFLSASTELSREFWKVLFGLSCLSVFSSLFACGLLWSLGNDPFYLLNVRLPTAPLLPALRDSCVPPLSVACSEHLPLLSACLISQVTPKLPELYRIHTTASKSSLRRATPLVHTRM